jgi:hypothetical protein
LALEGSEQCIHDLFLNEGPIEDPTTIVTRKENFKNKNRPLEIASVSASGADIRGYLCIPYNRITSTDSLRVARCYKYRFQLGQRNRGDAPK